MTWCVKVNAKAAMINPDGAQLQLKPEMYRAICEIAGPSEEGFWLDYGEFEAHNVEGHDFVTCDKCGSNSEQWGWYMPWYLEPFGLGQGNNTKEYIVIIFKQRDHALLFKLKFGGVMLHG